VTETATSKKPIKASEIDPKLKYELSRMHGGEKLLRCFQCGTCTSGCPVARFSDAYRPLTIIRMAQLGLKERVLNSETLCLGWAGTLKKVNKILKEDKALREQINAHLRESGLELKGTVETKHMLQVLTEDM
jgi:heterodisulfide reductase subunit B